MCLAAGIAILPPGVADPREYANPHGLGDFMMECNMEGSRAGIGGVCWPAGHIPVDDSRTMTLALADDVIPLASGFYCQDLDPDLVCGAGAGVRLVKDGEFKVRGGPEGGEPGMPFCGSVTLSALIGGNWYPDHPVYVFVDGPIHGAPFVNPCGTLTSETFHGWVSHVP